MCGLSDHNLRNGFHRQCSIFPSQGESNARRQCPEKLLQARRWPHNASQRVQLVERNRIFKLVVSRKLRAGTLDETRSRYQRLADRAVQASWDRLLRRKSLPCWERHVHQRQESNHGWLFLQYSQVARENWLVPHVKELTHGPCPPQLVPIRSPAKMADIQRISVHDQGVHARTDRNRIWMAAWNRTSLL